MVGTPIADDYEYIKARMEEIAKERAEPQLADHLADVSKGSDMPYLGWDIYAPVTM